MPLDELSLITIDVWKTGSYTQKNLMRLMHDNFGKSTRLSRFSQSNKDFVEPQTLAFGKVEKANE